MSKKNDLKRFTLHFPIRRVQHPGIGDKSYYEMQVVPFPYSYEEWNEGKMSHFWHLPVEVEAENAWEAHWMGLDLRLAVPK